MSLYIISNLTELEKKQIQEKVVKALNVYENCIGGLMNESHPPITQQFTVNIGSSSQDKGTKSKTENHLIKKEEVKGFVDHVTEAINSLPEMQRMIIINTYIKKLPRVETIQLLQMKYKFYTSIRSFSRKKRMALFDLALHLKYIDEEQYYSLRNIKTQDL